MLEVIGIVLFALIIAGSIALHELGHLLPAKRFGVKVTEYMVGFGPTIWARQAGETSYGIKAIPLGGYIRMIGMLPPAKGASTGPQPDGLMEPDSGQVARPVGRFATLVNDARQASLAEIGPGDADRVFYRLPVRKRIIIMLGGPVMNLLLAFVLFAIMLVGIGLPQPTTTVDAVVPCTPSAAQPFAEPLPSGNCPTGSTASPAAQAGLQPGDVITAVDGRSVTQWDQITSWIRDHGGDQAVLTVERGGTSVSVPVRIATVDRPVLDEQGNLTDQTVRTGFLGVAPDFAYVSQGWAAVPAYVWDITVASVEGLISLPIRTYELVSQTLIGGGEREIDSPVSVVGVSRLGGDIAAMEEPIQTKAATFLGLAASLNLFL
ncbi:MAG: M50 family metallopeptidase, partial [Actinomycetales bacterium]